LRKVVQVSEVILRNEVSVNFDTLGDFDLLNGSTANSTRRGGSSSSTTLEVEVVNSETDTSEEEDGKDVLGVSAERFTDGEGRVVGSDGESLVLITSGLNEDAKDKRELHGFSVDVRGEGVLDGGLLASRENTLVGVTREVLVVTVVVVEGVEVTSDEDGSVFRVAFDVVDDNDGFNLFTSSDSAAFVFGEDSDGTETETEGFLTRFSVEGIFSTSVTIIINVVIIISTNDDSKKDHGNQPES
jgi:hypothetical protein